MHVTSENKSNVFACMVQFDKYKMFIFANGVNFEVIFDVCMTF